MGADSSHGVGTTVDSGLPDIQGTHKIGWGDKVAVAPLYLLIQLLVLFILRAMSELFLVRELPNRLVTTIEIRLVLKLVIIILSMAKAPQSNLLLSSVIFGND